ncbi:MULTISPECIES: beta-ketoacyl synthase N-terminal-like domain-containing protein [unclassified Microcoleus]|uniref:beta-ketoacyl synthase N-terminal-like domain-containing protein n=1 Tax=unclassified Microcoleus TaxID=2642155 RepID=UPI002FD36805
MNNSTEINRFDGKDEIAIVGMAGRFPGAKDVEIFWQNLRDGVESISFFTDKELISTGTEPAVFNDPKYVKAGTVLEDIELFDAAFFGFTPREAEIADPQQRLFLECAWEALENSGYNSDTYPGQIGLFAGVTLSSYLFSNLYPHRDLIGSVDLFQVLIGNDKDHIATQTSYKLNLKGPSINIQTTCSTSLVAVHLACQSLLNGESDIALAGGVSIQVPQKTGYLYQEGGINSPDGHCRAFDANAQGTIFGSGLGIVVLKRLEDAVADGDCIQAVIKGSAINNDGSLKVGYTAPSVEGQREVILEALALAGVEAETISYIEAHGTGTSLGDPIEIAALTQAFRTNTNRNNFCAIGSVKTNVGHLNTAAGITGLIKSIQALKHKQIPASLHFQEPNPQIDFANSPFYVNTTLSEWKTNGNPRRAGVSSFGIGGTNAHIILEETPALEASSSSRPWQLLLLSAKTNTALEIATANLAKHLQQHPDLNIADVAYTLQVGRRTFEHRRMVVCHDIEDALNALTNVDTQRVFTHYQKPSHRPSVFMFSGQGAQYVNMGRELYEVEPTFREQIDICSEILKPHLGIDLRSILYPSEAQIAEASQQLQQTAITQPAMFVVEYAIAKLWIQWGVNPVALIGHSIGEYVAATLAGVFSLEDALFLVAIRGKLMQKLPSGSMLAVPLPEQEVQPFLGKELSLAAINTPSSCVVSGSTEAIETLQNQLNSQAIDCRRLHTSHAFHSEMMQPIVEQFALAIKKVKLNPPHIPFISNVTGTWIAENEATNPRYWSKHLRQTVRFSAGISELLKQSEAIFLEVGPGRTLSSLTKRHLEPDAKHLVLNSLRHPQEQQSDVALLLNALGRLLMAGVKIDWSGFSSHESRHRLPLPTYPFERQRYWIDAKSPSLSGSNNSTTSDKKDRWLVFVDESGAGSQLLNKLEQKGQNVITLKLGEQFAKLSEGIYTINPQKQEDIDALLAELIPDTKPSQQTDSSPRYLRPSLGNSYIPPTNDLEQQIAEMWQEVIGIKQVGIHDNFFELGGDSLIATQLVSRLRSNFPVELPLRDLLLQASTVAKQAETIDQLLLEKIADLSDEEVEALLAN